MKYIQTFLKSKKKFQLNQMFDLNKTQSLDCKMLYSISVYLGLVLILDPVNNTYIDS